MSVLHLTCWFMAVVYLHLHPPLSLHTLSTAEQELQVAAEVEDSETKGLYVCWHVYECFCVCVCLL